jgi:LysR family transcriptional regulator of gallate degradation
MISLDIPSLRQLRGFEAVARLKSFSGAAREVNLSQPALTQSVRALETRFAAHLLVRRHSGCFVTESGAILLPRIQRFFDHIRAALSELMLASASTGRQSVDAIVNKLTRPQFRSLIAISENPSLDAAARWLGISEPSLHRSARQLEHELRRSLLQRTTRGVTTTSQGSELARRFQVAQREIEYGTEEMQAARGVIVSRIAIGNIPHSATVVLSSAIQKLLATYPDTRVQVVDDHYEALLGDLRAGKLDVLFGVLRRPAWAIDTNEEYLFANPYTVVARRDHPLARLRRITLRPRRLRLGAARPRHAAKGGFRAAIRQVEILAASQHRDHLARSLPFHFGVKRSAIAFFADRNRTNRSPNPFPGEIAL